MSEKPAKAAKPAASKPAGSRKPVRKLICGPRVSDTGSPCRLAAPPSSGPPTQADRDRSRASAIPHEPTSEARRGLSKAA